jgi:sugar fermentation stimulation protein A
MKNLRQRIVRHKRKDKKLHWHIDYLLAHPEVDLLETITYPSEIKEECIYNQLLIKNRAEIPVLGFGSSDCKKCPSHLVRVNALKRVIKSIQV